MYPRLCSAAFHFLNVDSGDLNLGLLVLRQKVPLLTEPSVQLQKLSTCYGGGGGVGGVSITLSALGRKDPRPFSGLQ